MSISESIETMKLNFQPFAVVGFCVFQIKNSALTWVKQKMKLKVVFRQLFF